VAACAGTAAVGRAAVVVGVSSRNTMKPTTPAARPSPITRPTTTPTNTPRRFGGGAGAGAGTSTTCGTTIGGASVVGLAGTVGCVGSGVASAHIGEGSGV